MSQMRRSPLRIASVDLSAGTIDELTGQLGDEPFELELLLERRAVRRLPAGGAR